MISQWAIQDGVPADIFTVQAIACSAIQIVRALGNPHIRPVYSATYVIQFVVFFSHSVHNARILSLSSRCAVL